MCKNLLHNFSKLNLLIFINNDMNEKQMVILSALYFKRDLYLITKVWGGTINEAVVKSICTDKINILLMQYIMKRNNDDIIFHTIVNIGKRSSFWNKINIFMHSILILLHLVKIAQVLQVCYGVSMYIQKENNFLFKYIYT